MASCACGWTVFSPQGEEQATKHVRLHIKEVHPDTLVTDAEIAQMIRSV